MVRILVASFFIALFTVHYGQDYHYSQAYEADTSSYERQKRDLMKKYDEERRKNTKPPQMKNGLYWAMAVLEERDQRRAEGWDVECGLQGLEYYDGDSLVIIYGIPCNPWYMQWKREYTIRPENYNNGNLCTIGEFLVLTWYQREFSFPVNRHMYYWRNGKIRSIATFDKYGNAICDSLFNKRGKFREVKEIDIKEKVPGR